MERAGPDDVYSIHFKVLYVGNTAAVRDFHFCVVRILNDHENRLVRLKGISIKYERYSAIRTYGYKGAGGMS